MPRHNRAAVVHLVVSPPLVPAEEVDAELLRLGKDLYALTRAGRRFETLMAAKRDDLAVLAKREGVPLDDHLERIRRDPEHEFTRSSTAARIVWERLEAISDRIEDIRPATVAGLAVKYALLRSQIGGITDWESARMADFAEDLARVAGRDPL